MLTFQAEAWSPIVVADACRIQQVPAPTFSEKARSHFMYNQLQQLGLEVERDEDSDNVYARLRGGDSPPIILSAHLDSVIPPAIETPLIREEKRVTGPGIGDNALGLAAILAFGRYFKEHDYLFPGDIWLVADSAEEGLGNLTGMRRVVDKFGGNVTAYIVLEGIGLGFIQYAALGIVRLRIEVRVPGGHAWGNYGEPSAIHELVNFGGKILSIHLPQQPKTTINLGKICGGESINSLAAKAWLEVEVRSEDPATLNRIVGQIHTLANSIHPSSVQLTVEMIGSRPSGSLNIAHPLIKACEKALTRSQVKPQLTITSSDASLPISLGYPAVCLGITSGARVHSADESIDIPPIPTGLTQVLQVIDILWPGSI